MVLSWHARLFSGLAVANPHMLQLMPIVPILHDEDVERTLPGSDLFEGLSATAGRRGLFLLRAHHCNLHVRLDLCE